jgi:hypothetical protein
MILIADAKARLMLSRFVQPGQAVEVEELPEGELRLVRLKKESHPRVSLADLYAPVQGAGFAPGRVKSETVAASGAAPRCAQRPWP